MSSDAHVVGDEIDDERDGDPHAANARLASHHFRIEGDSIEFQHRMPPELQPGSLCQSMISITAPRLPRRKVLEGIRLPATASKTTPIQTLDGDSEDEYDSGHLCGSRITLKRRPAICGRRSCARFLTTTGVVIGIGAWSACSRSGRASSGTSRINSIRWTSSTTSSSRRRGPGRRPEVSRPGRTRRPSPCRPAGRSQRRERFQRSPVDAQFLEEAREIPGVETAFPELRFPAQIRFGKKEQFTLVQVLSASICKSAGGVSRGPLLRRERSQRYGGQRFPGATAEPGRARRWPGKEVEVVTLSLDFGFRNLVRMAFPKGDAGPSDRP